MTRITIDDDPRGYEGFPAGFRIIARNDMGDPLAVDGKGKVWCFPHGAGNWDERSEEFPSLDELHAYVAFQENCRAPEPEESLEALQARKALVQRFVKEHRKTRFVRMTLPSVVSDLRDEITDRKFRASKRGRNLTARQEVGKRCEEALRAAGVPGEWMVRAHAERANAVIAMGRYAAPWTEGRVEELLRPVLGTYELVCREKPLPKSDAG